MTNEETSNYRLISEIIITERFRKDLGDLNGLSRSIQEVGLLHPIVINERDELIAGQRRLQACKKLGWTEIPVHVVNIDNLTAGEFEENTNRKDFTISEIVAIKRFIEPAEKAKADQRQRSGKRPSGNFPQGRVRDLIARYVRKSGRTIDKAEKIVEVAEKDPERFLKNLEDVDSGRKSFEKAYQAVTNVEGLKAQTKARGRGEEGAKGDVIATKIPKSDKPIQEDSLSAKAFRLFEAGKGPIDVVMELNRAPDTANEDYESWKEMKKKDLSAPSVPAKLEELSAELKQISTIMNNVVGEIIFIEEGALAEAGLLRCQSCNKANLVSERVKDGFLLSCPECGYQFGPYGLNTLKPFFHHLFFLGRYENTKGSFAPFGIEWEDEPE